MSPERVTVTVTRVSGGYRLSAPALPGWVVTVTDGPSLALAVARLFDVSRNSSDGSATVAGG